MTRGMNKGGGGEQHRCHTLLSFGVVVNYNRYGNMTRNGIDLKIDLSAPAQSMIAAFAIGSMNKIWVRMTSVNVLVEGRQANPPAKDFADGLAGFGAR